VPERWYALLYSSETDLVLLGVRVPNALLTLEEEFFVIQITIGVV